MELSLQASKKPKLLLAKALVPKPLYFSSSLERLHHCICLCFPIVAHFAKPPVQVMCNFSITSYSEPSSPNTVMNIVYREGQ